MIVKFVALFCDGEPDYGCTHTADYGLTSTPETRRYAKADGWIYWERKDYCVHHAALLKMSTKSVD